MRQIPGLVLPLGLLLATTGAIPARAGTAVTVANTAQVPIVELYVAPSSSDAWGADRLGASTLAPGRLWHLALRAGTCRFDVQAIFRDGSEEERHGVDLCRTRKVSFAGADVASAHHIVIENRSGRGIAGIFVSPSTARGWGDNRLDGHALPEGDRALIDYAGACRSDLRILFDNSSAEERAQVDLCRADGIQITPGWTTADEPPAAGTRHT